MTRKVLDDAERRGLNDESVKYWLQRLQEACYEMDDVLDEWDYHLLQQQMEQSDTVIAPFDKVCFPIPSLSSCLCFKNVSTRHHIAKKIQRVKARLDGILKDKDRYGFVLTGEPIGHAWRVPSTSFVQVENVCGRTHDREIVTKLIMSNDAGKEKSGIQIISIVGQGGLGKTTLAQLVYNDDHVKDCFELRIWICVSEPFNLIEIAKGIVEKVEGSRPNIDNLDTLLECLKTSINGKRFLLVLDDVWTEKRDEWEPLETCLMSCAIGTKVLVTTRSEIVAKTTGTLENDMHHLKKLTDDDTWLLLSRIALPGKTEHEQEKFKLIGKKIARKCDGLPLAAKTLGSLLQFKKSIEEWKCVLESELWKLQGAEIDIFPHLLLSYYELSPALKCCFSYCGVFRKDSRINVESLIRNWLALGYLGSNECASELELLGREYFNYLAMHSLFQDFDYDNNDGEVTFCKMHDIVHDFAKFLRQSNTRGQETCQVCNTSLISHVKEYHTIFDYKERALYTCDCLMSVRVLSVGDYCCISDLERMENLIHLRELSMMNYSDQLTTKNFKIICKLYNLKSLILCKCDLVEIPREIEVLIQLRHLDLRCNQLKEIPREIGKLVWLKHLDLSFNNLKEIPREIGKLIQLWYLDLSFNDLKEIPREIGMLIQLRHLDLSKNEQLKELPENICNLLELRSLSIVRVTLSRLPQGIHKFKKLKHLWHDCGGYGQFPDQVIGQLSGLHTLDIFTGKLSYLKELNEIRVNLLLIIPKFCVGDEDIVNEAKEAELKKKPCLDALFMKFSEDVGEDDVDEDVYVRVLVALEPHHNLKSIAVLKYMGSKLPSWIVSPLNQLWQIRLSYFRNLTSLPPLGKLPFLKELYLDRLLKLEYMGRDVLGITKDTGNIASSSSSSSAILGFPKLIELDIQNCTMLREWEDITAEEEASTSLSGMLFPCLKKLTVSNCPRLSQLPSRLLSKASSLKKENIF